MFGEPPLADRTRTRKTGKTGYNIGRTGMFFIRINE
jgi:hypothetical protein